MALTEFQRDVCQVIARQRIESGESYIAGGAALNIATGSARLSDDIVIFHDRVEAVDVSIQKDVAALQSAGFSIGDIIRRGYLSETKVTRQGEVVEMQWTTDSAYRFFPLVEHDILGLTLHPFDLATNKTLAMVGRRAVRDWIDVIDCHKSIQPLGYLAWAAAGKDPGLGPSAIIEYAARARYQQEEVDEVTFIDGKNRDAGDLSRRWRNMIETAREIILELPSAKWGTCVMRTDFSLFAGTAAEAKRAFNAGELHFHRGCLRGAFPQIKDS